MLPVAAAEVNGASSDLRELKRHLSPDPLLQIVDMKIH